MTKMPRETHLLRMIMLLLLLAAVWLLWSGLFKPLLLFFGVLSCLLCFWLVWRMRYFDNRWFALRFNFRLLRFWLWLGREIVRSSIEVSRIILTPGLPISPRVLDIEPGSKHPFEQTVFGNSITLTPGTLTLDVHGGVIKVHALTETGARELEAGEMDRRVAGLREG